MHINGKANLYAWFVALVAWFALGLQLYLNIHNATANGLTVAETTGRYFTYFTILSNLLVALSLSIIWLSPGTLSGFFLRSSVQTAIAVYIFAVGLGYNILLRHIWDPKGMQKLADELLHVVVPVLYILYWFLFVPAAAIRWKNIFSWLIYPVVYAAFVLWRGSLDGFYPYYFVNVDELGYTDVAKILAGLFALILVIGCLFILIGRWKFNKRKIK